MTIEEIIINEAKADVKNGEDWINNLPDLKSFIIKCCKLSYNKAIHDSCEIVLNEDYSLAVRFNNYILKLIKR